MLPCQHGLRLAAGRPAVLIQATTAVDEWIANQRMVVTVLFPFVAAGHAFGLNMAAHVQQRRAVCTSTVVWRGGNANQQWHVAAAAVGSVVLASGIGCCVALLIHPQLCQLLC